MSQEPSLPEPSILTFDTPEAAADACADRILDSLNQTRRDRGQAAIALSGGSTPRLMFQTMAQRSFHWREI